jgi:hypothetical protein
MPFIFKCLLGFLNPNFNFTPVTKLNVLIRILFYAKLNPHCLRGEGAGLSASPSPPTTLSTVEALAAGFSIKLPCCNRLLNMTLIRDVPNTKSDSGGMDDITLF